MDKVKIGIIGIGNMGSAHCQTILAGNVPELELAFLTAQGLEDPYRRLRLDGAVDEILLRKNRSQLRFAQKVHTALVEEAVHSLAQAKEMHDQLEGLYNPYVDFGLVEETARQIFEEL